MQLRVLTNRQVGTIRRLLFIRGQHRWNGWVRGWTAYLG